MAKVTKISDKLSKVSDNFTVNMYDNGFMMEIGGRNKDDDWATAKIMCNSIEELVTLLNEAAGMERE
jgi:hypothetical protein